MAQVHSIVYTVNAYRCRMSRMAKEVVLRCLADGRELPRLSYAWMSRFYRMVRDGVQNGGDDVPLDCLARHHWEGEMLGTILNQALNIWSRTWVEELQKHYVKHYRRMYARWCKQMNRENEAFNIDPAEQNVPIEVLVR